MRKILSAFGAFIILSLGSPAYAQYVMDWNAGNNLIMSSIQNDNYNRERARADEANGRTVESNPRNRPRQAASDSIVTQLSNASIAQLGPEFQRRTRLFGKPAASQWLNTAARDIGSQMGSMAPEYKRRVAAEGRSSADRWYLDAARIAGRQYAAAASKQVK